MASDKSGLSSGPPFRPICSRCDFASASCQCHRRRDVERVVVLDGRRIQFHEAMERPDERRRRAVVADHAGRLLPAICMAPVPRQFGEALGNDPMLRSIDQMWNANPLRDVVPVDWAEIARALRTVWLRSMRQPVNAMSAVTELNTRLLTAATEVWNEAGKALAERRGPDGSQAVRRLRQALCRAGMAQ